MRLLHWIAALLTLFAGVCLADELRSIELQARPAEELVPILKPLAGDAVGISGSGSYLFLRAETERLDQLEAIVHKLDVAGRQLLISVFQGRLDGALGQTAGDRPQGIRGTRTRSRLEATHQLRATEGRRAFIATGSARPVRFSGWSRGPGGAQVTQGSAYRNSLSGFYVLPRIHGDRVSVEITPFSEHPGADERQLQVQWAATTVSGRIGQWLFLGGIERETSADRQREFIERRSTTQHGQRRIAIKVELRD